MTTITNSSFADTIGVHFTTASRLRNGERKPGLSIVLAAIKQYGLSCEEIRDWLEAIGQGADESGRWLRKRIFEQPLEPAA